MSTSENEVTTDLSQPRGPNGAPPEVPPRALPRAVGRYRVMDLLGKGAFGLVYLGYDEQLARPVAIKVPHPQRVSCPEDVEAYLAEARALARLDHPNIVPVHDVGRTEDGLCYVVSKFIAGSDLAARIKQGRPPFDAAAGLVAAVAGALHHAHKRGLVHRDVKPANILLDADGRPHLVDFGLALRDEDFGKGARFAGTLAYASPEQARGEGHRVDGRSDVFSLGVVFYELLTGRRPFRGETWADLQEAVISAEARPPRQADDAIPRELERVCLKALAKRAAERYSTAQDMADDLRAFLREGAGSPAPSLSLLSAPTAEALPTLPAPAGPPASDQAPLRVVPKGLRSYDRDDADFFLGLLPGPRDRNGLPEAIRFWKAAVEGRDGEKSFPVGLLYGPSGCGKSSLVKAGLLPLLAPDVVAVYVEAAADETEARLLRGLERKCPGLPAGAGLAEALAAVRRGRGAPAGRKVLLVLDQFEQWLHGKRQEEDTELARALRQCDGERLQCLLLVRDDFWMAVSRFMKELEAGTVEGHNAAAVDLFNVRHARKVLTAFGRAFEALPGLPAELSREQSSFLDQAVAGLAQDGKVSPVRLALFAEMVKGRPWVPATLRAVGGAEGVGVTFLEETFSAAAAPPEHRLHQRAAQAVLKALLPEAGGDIKGNRRSRQELLSASGYADRPEDFARLLRVLDGELRLLTPSDPAAEAGGAGPPAAPGGQFYQLTHDYLVPALREWLARKKKETWRGRAELRLAERAALWQSKPVARHLPAWWEWADVRLLTRRRDWTPSQRRMMRKAGRYHAARGVLLALALLLLGWGGVEWFGRLRAHELRRRLLNAAAANVPEAVADMAPYRHWVDPLLEEAYAQTHDDSGRLRLGLALLPTHPEQAEHLHQRLLTAGPEDARVIRDALGPQKDRWVEPLWAELGDRRGDPDRRFRAACALAAYDPEDARWEKVRGDVAAKLVAEPTLLLPAWAEALKGAGPRLLPPLAEFLEDDKRGDAERRTVANLYQVFAAGREGPFARLEEKLGGGFGQGASAEARVALAKRKANVGTALVTMGRGDKVWPLLRHTDDPTVRSYLIERLGAPGVDARDLESQFDRETDASVQRALILALGPGAGRLSPAEQGRLTAKLLGLYRGHPDAGIHAAAEWVLRRWGLKGRLSEIDRGLATGRVEGNRRWFLNGVGETFVIIPGPVETWVGEPEGQHRELIRHTFAIAAKEVTVADFLRFRKGHPYEEQHAPHVDCPVINVSWYDAAEYCNWLSEREGLPEDQWCYLRNEEGQYGEGMRLAPDYRQRKGYRLPREAEWECACRAGSRTGWSFGDADEGLVGEYAWYLGNSHGASGRRSSPVGTRKPNDFGLFDMHGNVSEWCHDIQREGGHRPGAEQNDRDEAAGVRDHVNRMTCGGCFYRVIESVRSASRVGLWASLKSNSVGFRPVKTLP